MTAVQAEARRIAGRLERRGIRHLDADDAKASVLLLLLASLWERKPTPEAANDNGIRHW
jgi:hypothetical protein